MAIAIHWDLAGKCGLREMKGVMTMSRKLCSVKMTITNICETSVSHQTMKLSARRLDLVIIYKRDKSCQNMEVAIPEDGPGKEKEDEKAEKYQDLFEKFENCRM